MTNLFSVTDLRQPQAVWQQFVRQRGRSYSWMTSEPAGFVIKTIIVIKQKTCISRRRFCLHAAAFSFVLAAGFCVYPSSSVDFFYCQTRYCKIPSCIVVRRSQWLLHYYLIFAATLFCFLTMKTLTNINGPIANTIAKLFIFKYKNNHKLIYFDLGETVIHSSKYIVSQNLLACVQCSLRGN